jgi:hypothetical protein
MNEYHQAMWEWREFRGRVTIHTSEECPDCTHLTPKAEALLNQIRVTKERMEEEWKREENMFKAFTDFLGGKQVTARFPASHLTRYTFPLEFIQLVKE